MNKFFFLFFLFFIFLFFGCIEQKSTVEQNTSVLEEKKEPLKENNQKPPAIQEQRSKIFTNSSNHSICENENQTSCYFLTAIKLDDPTICYSLSYGEDFFSCIEQWCLKTNKSNILDCEKYSDANRRLICLNNCVQLER
ncbi:MAG: hypothetical protein N3D10_02010 [Candidatus Micrarchaeota archaeon]|nr:hypothetical protein [Candidatus Micrarchaeota archaeon]